MSLLHWWLHQISLRTCVQCDSVSLSQHGKLDILSQEFTIQFRQYKPFWSSQTGSSTNKSSEVFMRSRDGKESDSRSRKIWTRKQGHIYPERFLEGWGLVLCIFGNCGERSIAVTFPNLADTQLVPVLIWRLLSLWEESTESSFIISLSNFA